MLTARLVRHGESIANAGGVTGFSEDIALTDRGHQQAQEFSLSLSGPPDLIITSPYLRAIETAAPTRARFPSVPVEVWPIHEICCLKPQKRLLTNSEQRRPWVEAFWARRDPNHCEGDGAECYADFIARVRHMMDRLAELPPQSVLIFSHGQFMKAVMWEIQETSPPVTPDTMSAFRAFHLADPIANIDGFTMQVSETRWRIVN